MPVPITDSELVLRAKAGDQHALTMMYERYAPALYRYIFYRVSDVEVAEDVCADVFVRMLEGIHRYEDRGWPLSSWLYRIAHDRTVDALRRHRVRAQVSIEDWSGMVDGPEGIVAIQLDCEEMRQDLLLLTPDQRTVIEMRFLQDMSTQEITHALGRNEGAVKALQHRAMRALRKLNHRSRCT